MQSDYMLRYEESQKGRTVILQFNKICPESSGTVEEQTKKLDTPGLTLVTIFKDGNKLVGDFENVIERLAHLKSFTPTPLLHATLLGIFPHRTVYWNPYYEQLVLEKLDEFFKLIKSDGYKIRFRLNFHLARPGTWYGLENNPIPFASNGTVVAVGELDSQGNKKFVKLGNDVASYLKNNLSPIFGMEFQRKFPTVWVTLGYFNKDFSIGNKIKGYLSMQKLNFTCDVNEIELRSFTKKSMENSVRIQLYK